MFFLSFLNKIDCVETFYPAGTFIDIAELRRIIGRNNTKERSEIF